MMLILTPQLDLFEHILTKQYTPILSYPLRSIFLRLPYALNLPHQLTLHFSLTAIIPNFNFLSRLYPIQEQAPTRIVLPFPFRLKRKTTLVGKTADNVIGFLRKSRIDQSLQLFSDQIINEIYTLLYALLVTIFLDVHHYAEEVIKSTRVPCQSAPQLLLRLATAL